LLAIVRRNHQLERIVYTIGPERALSFVEQALAVEANGGMWLEKQQRRRTLGGIFFHLVRGAVSTDEQERIWPARRPARAQPHQTPPQQGTASNPAPVPVERFTWEELPAITNQLQLGKATTVKMTIIGRPAQVMQKPGFVILGMTYDKQPSLPKGLPDFPAQPVKYMVLVSSRQWNRVAGALDNPEDALIIEGTPAHDHRFHGMILYATNVTSKLQQQAKRASQATAPA
jgi:hypothetical protein